MTNEEGTQIDSMAEDLQCYSSAETHSKVNEFKGTFGMPKLRQTKFTFKKSEYQKDAKVEVVEADLQWRSCSNTYPTLKMQQVISKMIIL